MRVRCPHCQNPIELVDETALGEITCPDCHSNFSLLGDETLSVKFGPNKKVAHFELISLLGSGGFGTVWMARDTELDRTVAIKVPRKEQLAKDEIEQFLREARAAAQLRHPNIVTVYEIGRDDDTIYIVSEFICGVSLADWLTSHRLSFRESAELVMTIAGALRHAHEAGVVHRDVKPSNIMVEITSSPHLGEGGHGGRQSTTNDPPSSSSLKPFITDFGLAKRESGEITITIDGKILGTPAYMSPEQAEGKGHFADGRTDVYSLGVVLFQLLTNELPFRGNQRMLIHQVVHDDPPNPRSLNNQIPRDLEIICLKAMAKDPAQRFQRAAELGEDLHRFLNGEPIRAQRPTATLRIYKWWTKNRQFALVLFTLPLFFAIPVALIMEGFYHSISHRAEFAQREKRGIVYVRPLYSLLEKLREIRTLSWYSARGASTAKTVLLTKVGEVDSDFRDLAAVDESLGVILSTTSQFNLLHENWRVLRDQLRHESLKPSMPDTDSLHIRLMEKVRELIAHVGDTSVLILDPDLDSYYLMDSVLLKLPDGADLLTEAQILGSELIAEYGALGMLPREKKARCIRHAEMIRSNIAQTRKGMESAFRPTSNPGRNLESALAGTLRQYEDAVKTVLRTFQQQIVDAEKVSITSEDYDQVIIAAQAAGLQFWNRSIAELDGLLDLRLAQIHVQITKTVIVCTLMLLLAYGL